ncbi:hypothetical protein B0T26DRAFT_756488 [Lasiosphaeria miniovina]|uniref:DUF6594 domain-containing protein n=1 Tax=Lasiosphaeria miniovina TaxID=1954250 RepID=A0AA40A0Q7_9PEZI|nr:uncharacterized protein B0T26DRAFT_756488 [Lasiosphaeria miniovina]KAK0707099.1 hypothetical protein B0T26DRAFT_756488 [Lasiosphaeria miniovina]
MPFHRQRRRRNWDEESPKKGQQINVDFDDDRWIIDVNLHNIIVKISRSRSPMDSLQGLLYSANNATDGSEVQGEQSYLINFAVLQRINIAQLRVKLIRQAIDLRFKARQPAGWTDTLQLYSKSYPDQNPPEFSRNCLTNSSLTAQALKDYEYMEKCHLLPDDPFYVSGERHSDRKLLQHLIGDRGDHIVKRVVSKGVWEKGAADPDSSARYNTRPENYRRSWIKGFWERIGVATLSGAFLITPMWLMVLHNTLYTGLVSTTGFVTLFGLMAAAFLRNPTEVMSCTAAYAAVLVVFVGLTTDSPQA